MNCHSWFSSSMLNNPACLHTVPMPWLWSDLKRLSKTVCKGWKEGHVLSMILTPDPSDDTLRFRRHQLCYVLWCVRASTLFSHFYYENAQPVTQRFFILCYQNIAWALGFVLFGIVKIPPLLKRPNCPVSWAPRVIRNVGLLRLTDFFFWKRSNNGR